MKLHLPKVLLAAVIGVMTMSSLRAETVTITNDVGAALNASNYTSLTSSDTLVFALTDTNSNRYWNSGGTINANIVIGSDTVENSGMYIYNGNSGISVIYTGTVTGSGTMSKKNSGTNNHWKFRGDVSRFSGNIYLGTTINDDRKFYLDFENVSGSEPTVTKNVSGTGMITFATGTGTADDSGGNWLTYNYTTSVHTTADNALTVGNVITRTGDNIQSRVEIKGTAAMKFTESVTLAKLKLSTNTQDVTLTSGLVENITGTTGHTIRKTGEGELIIGNTTGNNLEVSEGKLTIRQGSTVSFTDLTVTGGEMDIYGTFQMTGAVNVEGGSLNVMSGAFIDTSALSEVYAWNGETSTLTYSVTIGTGWTINSGATIGVWNTYDYNSTTGVVVVEKEMQVVTGETFTWGGSDPGRDDAGEPLGNSGACVRFAGGTQSVTLAEATSTPFLLIAEGTTVTMTRESTAATFAADTVHLDGSLCLKDNTGYSISRWDGDGELVLAWEGSRTNADSIANFSGNLRIAAGTGLHISTGYSFSSVTVEDGGQLGLNGSYTGDITISGSGVANAADDTADHRGALKFGDGGTLIGNVTISGDKAALSTSGTHGGTIQGNITADGAGLEVLSGGGTASNSTITLTGNLSGINEVTTTAASMTVSGTVGGFGETFTKSGDGTLTLSRVSAVTSGTVVVSGGVLELTGSGEVGTLSGVAVEVKEGAKVKIGHDCAGWSGGISSITLLGEEGNVATMINNDTTNNGNTWNTDINLKGYATVTNGKLMSFGGALHAEGAGNTFASQLLIAQSYTVEVAAEGVLEISGQIVNSNHPQKENDAQLLKTGAGELKLTNTNNTFTRGGIALSEGTLTIANGAATTTAAAISGAGTLATSGEGTKTFSGAVDVGSLDAQGGDVVFNNTLTLNGESTISGNAAFGGLTTLNADLTVAGDTTLATTAASIAIGEGKTFSTNEGKLKVTGTAGSTSITTSADNAEVTTGNDAITINNAAVTVNSDTNYTLDAKLSGSTLANKGAGTATVKVAEGSTNDFNASQGSVAVDSQAAAVGNLTVGNEKTVTIGDGTGTATVSGTAALENGSTVGGNVTIADSGTLVISGTGFSTDGFGAMVEGTLTANADAVSLVNRIDVTDIMTSTTYVLATAQVMDITGVFTAENFYTGTLAEGMSVSVSVVQPMGSGTYTVDPATASQLVLTLTAENPGTLTQTSVAENGVSVTGTNITLTVTDSLAGVTGGFNVTVGEEAWQAIVDGMAPSGGIYQNATVTLTGADGATLDLATYTGGAVTLNKYAGTGTQGEYFVAYIPEPATATLSLLALALLAARRRRK